MNEDNEENKICFKVWMGANLCFTPFWNVGNLEIPLCNSGITKCLICIRCVCSYENFT